MIVQIYHVLQFIILPIKKLNYEIIRDSPKYESRRDKRN